jgi:hypothetical protein
MPARIPALVDRISQVSPPNLASSSLTCTYRGRARFIVWRFATRNICLVHHGTEVVSTCLSRQQALCSRVPDLQSSTSGRNPRSCLQRITEARRWFNADISGVRHGTFSTDQPAILHRSAFDTEQGLCSRDEASHASKPRMGLAKTASCVRLGEPL